MFNWIKKKDKKEAKEALPIAIESIKKLPTWNRIEPFLLLDKKSLWEERSEAILNISSADISKKERELKLLALFETPLDKDISYLIKEMNKKDINTVTEIKTLGREFSLQSFSFRKNDINNRKDYYSISLQLTLYYKENENEIAIYFEEFEKVPDKIVFDENLSAEYKKHLKMQEMLEMHRDVKRRFKHSYFSYGESKEGMEKEYYYNRKVKYLVINGEKITQQDQDYNPYQVSTIILAFNEFQKMKNELFTATLKSKISFLAKTTETAAMQIKPVETEEYQKFMIAELEKYKENLKI